MTATGAGIAILALLFFIISQIVDLLNPAGNPYRGIWAFMVLPALLVVGLILIPSGWVWERGRRRRLYPDVHDWQRFPRLDLNNPSQRKVLQIFGVGTLVVIPLIAVSTYEGYHYTDSTQFCGQVCHQVMQPEFTAYRNSPHARVTCAACHIGPGASWFVKAKISGVRQVFAVMFNTVLPPDSHADQRPAAGAGNLRTVPLAGQVLRLSAAHQVSLQLRREEYAAGDKHPRQDRGRRFLQRPCFRDPLAHGPQQPDRVCRGRPQQAGDSMDPGNESGYRAVTVYRSDGKGSGRPSSRRRNARRGLHGLPQPADAHLPVS